MFPLNRTWEKCLEIAEQNRELLLTPETDEAFWAHMTATHVVPHTTESMWSGHFLPATESMTEAETSCNLALCGYYKQAMSSLRSALELGLLSVYWNVGDDGHVVIRRWLNSREDTPRPREIWDRLTAHPGIASFCDQFGLKDEILELFGELSNYVHTRGRLYSNEFWDPELGLAVGQRASEIRVREWADTYRKVAWIILALHLAKYPVGTIRYDWNLKFGIDVPAFGGLSTPEVDRAEAFLGEEAFESLHELARHDETTVGLMEWIESKPDMTRDDVERQIRRMAMSDIEHQGFEAWEHNERKIYGSLPDGIPDEVEQRIRELRDWAQEAGFLESPEWIMAHLHGAANRDV